MDIKDLAKRSRWTEPTDLYIGTVIEYDMSDGGFSIIKENNLLPTREINRLSKLPKGIERNTAVGKLRYSKDPTVRNVGKELEQLFARYRIQFCEENGLDEKDLISIKRDALFVKKYCKCTEFGQYIHFKEKHTYDAFLQLPKIEIWYGKYSKQCDVKGISDEKVEQYHLEYILKVIEKYLNYVIEFNWEGALKYIIRIIDDYKMRRLPIGYYREFTDASDYSIMMAGKNFHITECDESMFDVLDIRTNFNNVLIPMLNLASQEYNK